MKNQNYLKIIFNLNNFSKDIYSQYIIILINSMMKILNIVFYNLMLEQKKYQSEQIFDVLYEKEFEQLLKSAKFIHVTKLININFLNNT